MRDQGNPCQRRRNLSRRDQALGPQPCATALKDKYAFKTEMDDQARRNMFRHIGKIAA